MKKISYFVLILAALILFSSCSDNKTGKTRLANVLFSPYEANVEFLVEADGESVCGTAKVAKGEGIRIDISSPDPFTGLNIVSDANDSTYLSFTYSSVRSDIPKSVLDKLTLALTLFSDENASVIKNSPQKSFVPCEEAYTMEGLSDINAYMIQFQSGNIHYMYIYDTVSGTPVYMNASDNGKIVEIKIKDFNTFER